MLHEPESDATGDLDALWARAREGDHEALARLLSQAEGLCMQVLVGSGQRVVDAEDLSQQVLVQLLGARAERADEVRNFRQFVKWRARGALSDHVRRKRPAPWAAVPSGDAVEERAVSPTRLALSREFQTGYQECVATLPIQQGDLVRMRYQDELEPARIAERLGHTANAVRVALHRAVVKLRECLAGKGLAP